MTNRFVPTRAGIVNLYEYADQTFEFAGGRLLLRGHNTSGKTKALELLFPFCLDGDISPAKLDPFAGTAKDMKWNLVGCVEQDQRVGYVWIEFERVGADGTVERITAGIGMKAWRDKPGVRRWYWLLRNRRIGEDVALVRADREPLSRADLVAAIGDDGELLDTPSEYRERLREDLFGFRTPDEYRVMLELMRQLRRPHLSKSLDPAGVAAMLASGLPAVDDALLRRLAGGLEQLEALESELARVRAVRTRLRSFHDRTYRAYCQALVREHGRALRSADTAARAAAEALREAELRTGALAAEEERLAERQAELGARVAELEGEERALVTSAAWASVAEVAQLGARVQDARSHASARRDAASEAAAEVVAAEAELITSTAAHAAAEAATEDRLDDAARTAKAAGLEARAASLRQQLGSGLELVVWRDGLRELARGTKAVLIHQGDLRRLTRRAESEERRARSILEAAVARLTTARDERSAADAAVTAERSARRTAVDGWASALQHLTLQPEELATVHEAAAAAATVEPSLGASAGRARTSIAGERAANRGRLGALAREVQTLQDEERALENDHDEPPATPSWARSSRDGRPGGPLWSAVDFRDDVSQKDRASIEAALYAAGLLDAWVTPEGTVLSPETLDVVLVPTEARPRGDVLSSALRADPSGPIDEAAVGRLLRSIAYGPTATDSQTVAAVGADGSFVVGPLQGRSQKSEAEWLGASARAARRARRLGEIRALLDGLAEQRAELVDAARGLQRREDGLAEELARFPSASALEVALRRLGSAASVEAQSLAEHEQADADAARHAQLVLAAAAAQREHAVEHGLPVALDDDALVDRREACSELIGKVDGVAHQLRAVALAREGLASLAERAEELRGRADAREAFAVGDEEQASRLSAEYATRERELGADATDVRLRHETASAALGEHRELRRRGAAALAEAHDKARDVERDRLQAADARDLTRERRESALGALRALGAHGVVVALDGDAPEDAADAATWPLTRALEVVRALPDRITQVRTPSGELAQRVTRSVMDLGQDLAEANLGVYTEAHDGVLVVHVSEGPSDRTLEDALAGLELDVTERERLLTTEERRVFGATLVEELADHLRVRIRGVYDRVDRMNTILRRCPTASGKVIQLAWRAQDDDGLKPMIDLLRRRAGAAGAQERDQLVAFFRSRITAARTDTIGAGAETMTETLATAFDYRAWHAFDLLQEHEGTRERLTRKRHAVGSGGEQAVLIHLPLFAAAAALYDETSAPRLIMLDEALSGIDDETRARVLKATVDFDLDLVMTSHELWGTYVTVPELGIYQLHRHNGEPGVHAIAFRWQGEVLRELEQAELLV